MTGQGARTVRDGSEPEPGPLDFWSFIDLANQRLSTEYGSSHQLATQVLLTLNRAANVVTYDLESSVHRPRGLSWSAFRLLFVTWLAGPVESKTAASLTGMSRAAVSNLTKTLVGGGLMERTPDERDVFFNDSSPTEKGRSEIGEIYREQ